MDLETQIEFEVCFSSTARLQDCSWMSSRPSPRIHHLKLDSVVQRDWDSCRQAAIWKTKSRRWKRSNSRRGTGNAAAKSWISRRQLSIDSRRTGVLKISLQRICDTDCAWTHTDSKIWPDTHRRWKGETCKLTLSWFVDSWPAFVKTPKVVSRIPKNLCFIWSLGLQCFSVHCRIHWRILVGSCLASRGAHK